MRNRGFTLVEVALAMLVVGIGIMAVFGLFPGGIEAGRRAVNETQAALFAEEVFAGYRAMSGTTVWASLNTLQIAPAASNLWSGATRIIPGGTRTSVQRAPYNTNIVERALRYELTIADSGTYVKTLRLRVFPGEFGGTTTNEVYEFYTEIFRGRP